MMQHFLKIRGIGLIWMVWIYPTILLAQLEGDTGYDYADAYDYDSAVSDSQPMFDVPYHNVTVVEGQTAELPCDISNLGRHKVVWTDPYDTVLTFDDRRVCDDSRISVVRPYMKSWNLAIRDVLYEDIGEYRCTVNTEPARSKTVMLYVKVPAHIIDELSSSDVSVREGDDVRLVCNVTGVPQPNVTWYYHEGTSRRDDKQRLDQGGEVLTLKSVTRDYPGMYTCVGDNGVPPAVSRQIKVNVEFPPEVTMVYQRVAQHQGKDTILECIIAAYPEAVNVWMKDGMAIETQTGKYRVEVYEEGANTITLVLYLYDLTESDYGEYSCRASNSLGSEEKTMELYESSGKPEDAGPQYIKPTDNPAGSSGVPHPNSSVALVAEALFPGLSVILSLLGQIWAA